MGVLTDDWGLLKKDFYKLFYFASTVEKYTENIELFTSKWSDKYPDYTEYLLKNYLNLYNPSYNCYFDVFSSSSN